MKENGTLEYILSFSSSYKAMYAGDKLLEQGIPSRVQKTPAELFRSCGQSLLIRGYEPEQILAVLQQNQIITKGVFRRIKNGESIEYRRIT